MKLTSTQIGAITENLIANELMIESRGRLSPFRPIADDDGIDVIIYDKVTGGALPIQIKARTNTIIKAGKETRSNTVHFEVRKATHRADRHALLLCVLVGGDLRSTERAWLLPLSELAAITNTKTEKYVIRANKQLSTNDRYKKYQCEDIAELGRRLIKEFEGGSSFRKGVISMAE